MTPTQKYHALMALVCDDFPHYAVAMAIAAGCKLPAQRLHDVKRSRTTNLADLVELVRHSLPRFEIPAHLLPEAQPAPVTA